MQTREETNEQSEEFAFDVNELRLHLPYGTLQEENSSRITLMNEFEATFLAPEACLFSKMKVIDSINSFLDKKYFFHPSQASFLVAHLYDFIVDVNIPTFYQVGGSQIIRRILRKKPALPNLKLSAIPLYERITEHFYSARRRPALLRTGVDWNRILENLRKLKYYFSVDSIEFVFERVKPLFYANDIKLMSQGQSLFLWFFPYHSEEQVEKNLALVVKWLSVVNNFPHWTKNWIHALCKISSHHGDKFFSEELLVTIFSKSCFIIEKQQVTLNFHEDSKWFLRYSFVSKKFTRSFAKLLVNIWNASVEDKLTKYFSLNETAFHPSSITSATKEFAMLIMNLAYFLFKKKICPVGFGKTLLKYSQLLIFSKDPLILERAFKCLKYLSVINSADTLSWMLDLAASEIFTANYESHRLLSSLGSLTYCARALLSGRIYPEGPVRLFKLIPSIIAFIDAGNPQKSLAALDLLFSIFHFFPIFPVKDEEFLFEIYYSFLTTALNALGELEMPKDKSLTVEFGFASMILMVVKHLIQQVPLSIYERLLEKMKLIFTERFFYPTNLFFPRLFGILKGSFQEQFLSVFLPQIFQNLSLFVQEKDEKMIAWNLHLLCRTVNQSGCSLLKFKAELQNLFSTDFSKFESEDIPKYLYKSLKLVLTNHLSIFPLEYGCLNERAADLKDAEMKVLNSSKDFNSDFTQPFDCSKIEINWHLIQREELSFCSLLINGILNKVESLSNFHRILVLKAVLKGIAYLSIQSTNSGIYQETFLNNPNLKSSSIQEDAEDNGLISELFDFTSKTKNQCLKLLHSAMNSNKLHYKSILEIIACWREINLPKSFLPNKLQKILASIKLMKSSLALYPNRHDLTRALFIQRCYTYHLQRCALGLEEELLNIEGLHYIVEMAMSDYDQVRNASLVVLNGIITLYDSSLEQALNYLEGNFTSTPSLEATKGLLGIFSQTIVLNLICSNPRLFIKFIRFIFSFELKDDALELFANLFQRIEQFFTIRIYDKDFVSSNDEKKSSSFEESFELLEFLLKIASNTLKHYTIRLAAVSVIHLFSCVRGVVWSERLLTFLLQNVLDSNGRLREYCINSYSNIQFLSKQRNEKKFLPTVSGTYFIDKPCYESPSGDALIECKLKEFKPSGESFQNGSVTYPLDKAYFSKLFSIFVCEDQRNNQSIVDFLKAIFQHLSADQADVIFEEWKILLEDQSVPHYEHCVSCAADIFIAAVKKLPPSAGMKFAALLPVYSLKCSLSIFHSWSEAIGRICSRKDPSRNLLLIDVILKWPSPAATNYLDFARKVSVEVSLLDCTHWRLVENFYPKIVENLQFSFDSDDFARELVLFLIYSWQGNFGLCEKIFPSILSLHSSNTCLFIKFFTLLIIDHCNQEIINSKFFWTATKLFFSLDEKNDAVFNKLLADTKNIFADLFFPSKLLMFALESLSDISNWKIYCDNLKALNRSFIRNAFSFSSQEITRLLICIKKLALSHKHAEVKLVCSHFVTGITMYFYSELNLLDDCNAQLDTVSNDSATQCEKHGAIFLVIGYLNAFPYSIEGSWMPQILERLAHFTLHDKSLIAASCRKFFLDFKRTHHDNWHVDREKFSEEQLSLLNDLLISPSYYV